MKKLLSNLNNVLKIIKKLSMPTIIIICLICFGTLLIITEIRTSPRAIEKKRVVEIMYFYGGYGREMMDEAIRQFEVTYPDVKIKIWVNSRITEKIRLRLLAKDPPEIIYTGGDGSIDLDKVVKDGFLVNLQPYLDGPAYEGSGSWESKFYKGILNDYRYPGNRTYGLPVYFDAYAIWYNTDIFNRFNLKPPKTWDEFLNVCETLKKNGIAPIALQGRYITYLGGIYNVLLNRIAGNDFYIRQQRLEAGTLNHPYQIKTAKMIQDCFKKGYFEDGCLGMTHTEAQMEFMQGRAGMVWCGTWLTSEMKDVIPKDMHYSGFNVPTVPGGLGDQTAVLVGSQDFFVCEGSKEKELAIKFLKFLSKKEIGVFFVKKKNALTAVKEPNKETPPILKDVVKILENAKSFVPNVPPDLPYRGFDNYFNSYLTDLVTLPAGSTNFKLTPEEFCKKLEDKAAEVRQEEDSIRAIQEK